MLPDRVSNPGPLTYESGALPIALRGPAIFSRRINSEWKKERIACMGVFYSHASNSFCLPFGHCLGKATGSHKNYFIL